MATRESDADLLAQYIATFEKFDDMSALSSLAMPPDLRSRTDESGLEYWQPRQITTPPLALEALYQGLGLAGLFAARFPPLYEMLLLSYRWATVDLGTYRLLANEPAADLSPLLSAMKADAHLYSVLVPNGYIQFGKGPDVDYDPLCFDFRHRQKSGDCRIVKLDHEAILCYGRVKETTEVAPNFRSLVLDTIHRSSMQTGIRT